MENEFEKGFMCGYLINYHVDDEPKPDQKEWTYPSSWLKLPEPADNQIVMLVDNRGSSVYNNTNYTFGTRFTLDSYHPTKVEWGDGSSDELTRDVIHTSKEAVIKLEIQNNGSLHLHLTETKIVIHIWMHYHLLMMRMYWQ